MKIMLKLLGVMFVSWGLIGCEQGQDVENASSSAEQLRAAILESNSSIAIGGIQLSSDASPDIKRAYCQIVVLMNPENGLLMNSEMADYLLDVIPSTVSQIYPEATSLNLFISTAPDRDNFQSASTMDLDDLTISLGMGRDEIESLLNDSEWRVSSRMGDYWGITANWPKSVEVYFESSSDDAKAVFLVPNPNGSGGGLSVISADFPLPPAESPSSSSSSFVF